jgi:hypothetical protein
MRPSPLGVLLPLGVWTAVRGAAVSLGVAAQAEQYGVGDILLHRWVYNRPAAENPRPRAADRRLRRRMGSAWRPAWQSRAG